MNVCLLGEQGTQLDEGMKNMSIQFHKHLTNEIDSVSLFDLREITNLSFWQQLSSLDPDIIHLIPGPTPQGLLLLRCIAGWKGARSVATATQPRYIDLILHSGSVLAPDKLLVQSTDLQRRCEQAGFATEFLPSGVDLERFTPLSDQSKDTLRQELSLPQNERLFLHVGHLKQGRHVTSLKQLREFGEVIIVGSPSTHPEEDIISDLQSAGCIVRTEYIDNIEHYYNAADIYVFPTQETSHSIQIPLSVFEAMACNLPVVTTRFGGLTDCFDDGNGVRFITRIEDVTREDITFNEEVNTREKVADYSWKSIMCRVREVYEHL